MKLRTETIDRTLAFADGWRPETPERLRHPSGEVLWMLQPPAARRWTSSGTLERSRPVAWRWEPGDAGTALVCDVKAPHTRAEVDFVELSEREAAAAFERSGPGATPMTVIGSWLPLGAPGDLARFLVGGEVLDATDFGGRRCPSEQTALSLYRIARLRGGPFWDGVAAHAASWAGRRAREAPGGLPAHDLLGRGETHLRFLVDGLLLLSAAGDDAGAGLLVAGLGRMAIAWGHGPWGQGTWYVHDSLEGQACAAGAAPHLVLNTHLHALLALTVAGADRADADTALDTALGLPPEGARAWVLAALLAASDAAGTLGRGQALADRAQEMAARSRARRPHLRLPGGWLARDAGLPPAPSYLIVNLADLAVLERNRPTAASSAALRAGLRYARATGHFRARRLAADPLSAIVPALLANAGEPSTARRAAEAVQRAGWAPTTGWPGFEDHLWPALAPGSP